MLILSETDVRQCLDMQECININRQALIAIATDDAIVPSRLGLPYRTIQNVNDEKSGDAAEDWTLFKPASLQKRQGNTIDNITPATATDSNTETVSMGMKVVSIRANNVRTGHPLVPATVLHINPVTGIVDAIVAATYLTAARTAAGSAIAIHHYFNQISKQHKNNDTTASGTEMETPPLRPQHVVVFGAGLQAEQHVRAIACIFEYAIPHVTIINRNTQRSEALKDQLLSERLVLSVSIEPLSSENSKRIEATIVLSADVIVTCTNTATPLWGTSAITDEARNSKETALWRNRLCIIAGIGSYTPFMQEIPSHIVNACQRIWIDTSEAAKVGDLKHLCSPSDCLPGRNTPQLLGSVLLHEQEIQHDNQHLKYCNGLVFYKAVGTAIQDVLTADVIVDKARRHGIGTSIDMS